MTTIQATTISGRMIPGASWNVRAASHLSVGEVFRINLPFEDEKLARILSKSSQVQECTMEREESGNSVTLGFLVEKFTHMLDDGEASPEVESMAWLKPMNRSVESVLCYLRDRENCDPKFLAAMGATRREE